jgi:hypothetical protein
LTLADERDQTAAPGVEVKVYPYVDKGREVLSPIDSAQVFARGVGLLGSIWICGPALPDACRN